MVSREKLTAALDSFMQVSTARGDNTSADFPNLLDDRSRLDSRDLKRVVKSMEAALRWKNRRLSLLLWFGKSRGVGGSGVVGAAGRTAVIPALAMWPPKLESSTLPARLLPNFFLLSLTAEKNAEAFSEMDLSRLVTESTDVIEVTESVDLSLIFGALGLDLDLLRPLLSNSFCCAFATLSNSWIANDSASAG